MGGCLSCQEDDEETQPLLLASTVVRPPATDPAASSSTRCQLTCTFSTSLEELYDSSGDPVPLVMRKSVDYIVQHGLSTEGLFRCSPSLRIVKEVKNKFNTGEDVNFTEYDDPHLAAAILKLFLREMPRPILVEDSIPKIVAIKSLPKDQRIPQCIRIVHELPPLNYTVLKYLFEFIVKVALNDDNKMDTANLSKVIAPNLLWSDDQLVTLNSMSATIQFTRIVIEHCAIIFTK